MPRFAANLTMLFTELPFLDRFDAAARAGFQAVEFLFPYAFEANDIKARLDANGLQLVLHNLPAGDWDAGERGIACHPDRVEEFRAGVERAIAYAQTLGVKQLNCLVGKARPGCPTACCARPWWPTCATPLRASRPLGCACWWSPSTTTTFPAST